MTRDPDEWLRQQRLRWCSQRKLFDYHVDRLLPPDVDGYRAIYEAVISGKIRSRTKGNVLTKQEAAELAKIKWSSDPDQPYMLPPDLGLSIEDAEEMFG